MKAKIPPPLFLLVFGAAMWWVAQSRFGFRVDQPWLTAIAWPVGLTGLAFDLLALGRFRSARTTINPLRPEKSSSLVTGGVYRVTRNPMYVGLLLLLCAWGLWLGSPLNLLLIGAFVLTITKLQIEPEEAVLRSLFGDDYTAYCSKVRRWL